MSSLYDEVGGEPVFRQLVDRFYEGVAVDPVLRPLYPDEDLSAARDRLRMFLVQYWGGPTTYSEARGHPRLRMRHSTWVIGEQERDARSRCSQTAARASSVRSSEATASRMWPSHASRSCSPIAQVLCRIRSLGWPRASL